MAEQALRRLARPQADSQVEATAHKATAAHSAAASTLAETGRRGQPLAPILRARMEQGFAASFADVRVHHDTAAQGSAQALGALALARGAHLAFAPGQFRPDGAAGERLLAHELAHVLQARRTPGGAGLALKPAPRRQRLSANSVDGMAFINYEGATWMSYFFPSGRAKTYVSAGNDGFDYATVELPASHEGEMRKSEACVAAERAGAARYAQWTNEDGGSSYVLSVRSGLPSADLPQPVAPKPFKAPPEKPKPLPDKTAEQLISDDSVLGFLDEETLGRRLLAYGLADDTARVTATLDALGSTDRDDVATALVEAASDEDLARLAQTEAGRLLLSRLYDEMSSGHLGEDEQKQSERVLMARAARSDPQAFIDAPDKAPVIPFSGLGLTKFTTASISAHLLDDGRIRVKSYMKQEHWPDAKRLPLNFVLGLSSMDLDPDQVVGVHLYDEGGTVVYMPALYLLQLGNQQDTKVLSMSSEAFAAGLTLGTGGAAVGAGEATAAGTAGLWATRGATALLWADRAATVIAIASTVINDHRGLILKHFGADGATFLKHWQTVETVVAVYGMARGAVALGQTANSLRKSFHTWRQLQKQARNLSAEESAALDAMAVKTEQALQDIEDAREQAKGTATRGPEQKVLAERPASHGHEIEVTPTGIEVCSPRPCPLLRVQYSRELRSDSKLIEEMDEIDALRKTQPEQAAERAAKLQGKLENIRTQKPAAPTVAAPARDAAGEAAERVDTQPMQLGVGQKRAEQIAAGERDFVHDQRLSFDIDEPFPVGDASAGVAEQRSRAFDPHNRQMLDSNTNRLTKGLGVDPRDFERAKTRLPTVSVVDQPDAIFIRRFDEVSELQELFDMAAKPLRSRTDLKPTEIKAAINREMRRLIKEAPSGPGARVRKALLDSGFEYQEGLGFVMMKGPKPPLTPSPP